MKEYIKMDYPESFKCKCGFMADTWVLEIRDNRIISEDKLCYCCVEKDKENQIIYREGRC